MKYRIRRGRTLGIVAGITGAAALGPVAAAQATPTVYPSTGISSYTTNDTLSGAATASAIATVPTVSCAGVSDGVTEGQSSLAGLQSSTNNADVVAGARHFCVGDQPEYTTEFSNADGDSVIFTPANVAISPGQTVKLFVRSYGTNTTATIKNLTTGQSASFTRRGTVHAPYPYVGVDGISSDGNGNPIVSGTPPTVGQELPGPVPATGEDFTKVKIDGLTLAHYDAKGNLGLVQWDDSDGNVLATPGPYSGDAFSVSETSGAPGPTAAPLVRASLTRRVAVN
jgi:plastocyanin